MVFGQWSMVGHSRWSWVMVDGRGHGRRGMLSALSPGMKAKNIDAVVVYKEALEAEHAVSAILDRPVFGKDLDLKGQLNRSSSRVAPLISEGFGQLTDRHLATYLARTRGSAGGNSNAPAESAEEEVHLRGRTH